MKKTFLIIACAVVVVGAVAVGGFLFLRNQTNNSQTTQISDTVNNVDTQLSGINSADFKDFQVDDLQYN